MTAKELAKQLYIKNYIEYLGFLIPLKTIKLFAIASSMREIDRILLNDLTIEEKNFYLEVQNEIEKL